MRLVRYIIPAALAFATLGAPLVSSHAQGVGISINLAPPGLPVYDQPPAPDDGYIWTPGYWAWANGEYYWVPGTWVLPPAPGDLWTPGYWGFVDGNYVWNDGYWGPTVGYYGGVNYGFGYTGRGYSGGRWQNGHFYYNRSVNNIDPKVSHNVYSAKVPVSHVSHPSFNGPGGATHRPTAAETTATHAQHKAITPLQSQHVQAAGTAGTAPRPAPKPAAKGAPPKKP
jgi:hypothetical protein